MEKEISERIALKRSQIPTRTQNGSYRKQAKRGVTKKIIDPDRLRHIDGGFSFIPHRFVTEGFLDSLNQKELLLYFFLTLVSDRHGLSFYSYDAIPASPQGLLDAVLDT